MLDICSLTSFLYYVWHSCYIQLVYSKRSDQRNYRERQSSPRPGLNSFGSPYRLPPRPSNAPSRYSARTHRNQRDIEVPESAPPHFNPPHQPSAYRQAPAYLRQENARNWGELINSSSTARQDSPVNSTAGTSSSQGLTMVTHSRPGILTEDVNTDPRFAKLPSAEGSSSVHGTKPSICDMNAAYTKELESLRSAAVNAGIRIAVEGETSGQVRRPGQLLAKKKSVLDPSSPPFTPKNSASGKSALNTTADASHDVGDTRVVVGNRVPDEANARHFTTTHLRRKAASLDGDTVNKGSSEHLGTGRRSLELPAATKAALDCYEIRPKHPKNLASLDKDSGESSSHAQSNENASRSSVGTSKLVEGGRAKENHNNCRYYLPPGSPFLDCNDSHNTSMSDEDISRSLPALALLPPSMRLGLHPRVALSMASTPAAPVVTREHQMVPWTSSGIRNIDNDMADHGGIVSHEEGQAKSRATEADEGLGRNMPQHWADLNATEAGGSGVNYRQDLSAVPVSMRLPTDMRSGLQLEIEQKAALLASRAPPVSEFPAARHYAPLVCDGWNHNRHGIPGYHSTSERIPLADLLPTPTSGYGMMDLPPAYSFVTGCGHGQEGAYPIPIPAARNRAVNDLAHQNLDEYLIARGAIRSPVPEYRSHMTGFHIPTVGREGQEEPNYRNHGTVPNYRNHGTVPDSVPPEADPWSLLQPGRERVRHGNLTGCTVTVHRDVYSSEWFRG